MLIFPNCNKNQPKIKKYKRESGSISAYQSPSMTNIIQFVLIHLKHILENSYVVMQLNFKSLKLLFLKKNLLTFVFFGWSILLKMSFAWDSRAAKLEGLGGGDSSFVFFAFFFPVSLTFGTLESLGALGIFGGFGGFGGLEGFFLDFSLLGDGMGDRETGSSGSQWVDGGSSTGNLMFGSLLMAFVAF